MAAPKQPVSVLVLIHTPELDVLLLERAGRPGYWQSVTGSREDRETLIKTARREVEEETGLKVPVEALRDLGIVNRYRIFEEWRYRYAAGVYYNTEHVFSLLVPAGTNVRIAPGEHLACRWLPWREAADACFSWSNRDAILMLARLGAAAGDP